jgi:L-iditol 2-dehydrogenase
MQKRLNLKWISPNQTLLDYGTIPALEPGEILLKVESCGICGSDLKIVKNGNHRVASGQIIGHEIAGTVFATEGSTSYRVGERLAIGADVPCGKCYYCNNGIANCCDINYAIGHQFEGGFSEYMVLNDLTLKLGPVQRISDSVSFDEASLAEPLACCINGYERAVFQQFSNVVIFGAGPIGLMLASLAPMYGAKNIIMIDPNQQRLDRAKSLGLANHLINPDHCNSQSVVLDITQGGGADLVFTANAVKETHVQGIGMLARRGVINLFGGLPKDSGSIAMDSNFIHYREAYITGSHGSTPEQHKKALSFIEGNQINHKAFITHKFSLEKFDEAFKVAQSGDAIKVIINPHN